MIRRAMQRDIPAIVDLCEQFATAHPLSAIIPFDKAYVTAGVEAFLTHPTTYIAVSTFNATVVGCIIGIAVSSLYNSAVTMVSEIMWYISPNHRHSTDALRLLDALEAWATTRGAAAIIMLSYETGSSVDRLYQRRGYVLTEHQWLKALEG